LANAVLLTNNFPGIMSAIGARFELNNDDIFSDPGPSMTKTRLDKDELLKSLDINQLLGGLSDLLDTFVDLQSFPLLYKEFPFVGPFVKS